MSRIAGFLTQWRVQQTQPSYGTADSSVRVNWPQQYEVEFRMIIDGSVGDLQGFSTNRVVLHDGSCDADRLGGLERERDQWRRQAEVQAAEIKTLRQKLSNATAKAATDKPPTFVVSEFRTARRFNVGDRVEVKRGPNVWIGDVIVAGDQKCVVRSVESGMPVETANQNLRLVEAVAVDLVPAKAPKKPAKPTPTDQRFAGLDLDEPEDAS